MISTEFGFVEKLTFLEMRHRATQLTMLLHDIYHFQILVFEISSERCIWNPKNSIVFEGKSIKMKLKMGTPPWMMPVDQSPEQVEEVADDLVPEPVAKFPDDEGEGLDELGKPIVS